MYSIDVVNMKYLSIPRNVRLGLRRESSWVMLFLKLGSPLILIELRLFWSYHLPTIRRSSSFFRKINFVWKFISGFAEIVHPLNDLLKKGAKIEWGLKIKKSFEDIKVAISMASVLVSLDYELPFKIYSFSLEDSCVGISTQKKRKRRM